MKILPFISALFLAGCVTPSTHPTPHVASSSTKTTVKITAFHKLPDSIMGSSFVVVPADTNAATNLEALSYADLLTHLLGNRGLKPVPSQDITNAQYVFFLRYKDTDEKYLPAGVHGCSLRIDVDSLPIPGFETASLSSADMLVATLGRYERALAIPCALRHYAAAFPFSGPNPFHHEFYYPTQLENESP